MIGKKPICVVSQKPFEVRGDSGIFTEFCSLLPLLNENGTRARADEYPDDGTIWWMLRPGTRGFAEPTRLVTGTLEETRYFGMEGKAHYQLQVDSVGPVRPQQFVEVIDVVHEAIREPRDLVSQRHHIVLDHVPMNEAYVRWCGKLIGPFRISTQPDPSIEGRWTATLAPANSTDQSVIQVPSDVLRRLPAASVHEITATVSLNSRPPDESERRHDCRYILVASDALRENIPHTATRIILLSDAQIVQRLAKQFFNRTKRQNLNQLLGELQDAISRSPEDVPEHDRILVADLVRSNELEVEQTKRLADALVEADFLKNAIQDAVETHAKKFVEQNAARLQAEVGQQIRELQGQRDQLQRRCEELEAGFQTRRRQVHRELEQELADKRKEFDDECAQRERDIESQRQDLDRQRQLLSASLEKVAARFENSRDDVINQFLALAPLLEQRGLLASNLRAGTVGSSLAGPQSEPEVAKGSAFQVPRFVVAPRAEPPAPMSEIEFFERFVRHAENCGFSYRKSDLASFHVSVKCSDLTILGGLSGTGKSSLPRLYAEALTGSETEPNRFLHVAVSPSWLDMRDLLGHFNALDDAFQPSESGLYEHLIYAQEEFTNRGPQTGMYLVCLDEMNLAHVEHYFHGFLQVLEQSDAHRELRCFSGSLGSENAQFARWATVRLPRSLRFIGTVNFDETTRQLSQRLLDRANLIRLPSDTMPGQLGEAKVAQVGGPPVTLQALRSWVSPSTTTTPEFGDLIDRLREPLRTLGCPMNPRRLRAIWQFISSFPAELGGSDSALDMQIAQRLLPQVRGLFRPGASEAVEAIRSLFERDSLRFGESLRVLREISDSEYFTAYDDRGEAT